MKLFVASLLFVGYAAAKIWEDGDTIIIDPSKPDTVPRYKREELVIKELGREEEDTVMIRSDQCITTRGKAGRCTTLKECYPILYDPNAPSSDNSIVKDPLADQLIAASGLCSGYEYRSDSSVLYTQVARSELLVCCVMQSRVVPPLPPPPPNATVHDVSDTKAGCGSLKINLQPLPEEPIPEQVDSQNRTNDETKIVNGREAQRGEFPWIVALMNNGREFCGGSLIDGKTIVTAAHCVQHMTSADVQKLTIQIGDHNIYSTADGRHEVRTASRILYHKDFSMQHLHHDVALISLTSPVSFTSYIQPVCLHTGSPNSDGVWGDVSGWGQLRDGGSQPSTLQTAKVKIWTNADCSRRYGSNAPAGIGNGMVCAGGDGPDSCRGDSGGPLTINSRSKAQLVGIVSFGIGCGSYPGVYTRVERYVPWISKNRRRTFAE